MKKLIIILFASITLYSCSNTDEQPKDKKAILDKIISYKMEIVEIEGKISQLDSNLIALEGESNQGSILVGTKTMLAKPFTHYIDVVGNVESDMQAYISPELSGLIKSINVIEGDYVKKGTNMATIDTEMTENSIDEVKTQLELAKSVYKKQKQLWDQKIGSEIQYLQAKSNKESLEKKLKTLRSQLRKANIIAPFSGYIETVKQKVGEFGNPNVPLFYIVNLDKLKITANISESFLPYINVNDPVSITFPTFPDLNIKAKIGVIGTVVNPNNRTIKLQIPIDNTNKKLIPNIIAKINVADQYFNEAFVVPSIVVKNDAHGKTYIYLVAEKDGKFYAQKQYITTGKSYGNKTMVTGGIKQDDQVITKAYNLVKNGSLIRL
ncbi:MAG: hypothetical protein B6I18_06995 [Bacteroidetes bacterium 4572_112]|nr:MAG: hypothetical protein B6I18_06995 [Bacteroidetes bacterium 4572_112]